MKDQTENLKPWKPGQSGNPGGRPKTKYLSEAYRRILYDRGADEFAETIANDALHADRARDRLAAVQEITDRTEGKAVQAVRIEPEMDEATALRLLDLYEKMFGERPSLAVADAPALPPGEAVNKLLE